MAWREIIVELFSSDIKMKETRVALAMRPILTLLYCFGFDFNEQQLHKTIQRVYSILWLSLNTAASLLYIIFRGKQFLVVEWDVKVFMGVLQMINFDVINIIGINAALNNLSWNGMVSLWKALRQLEESYEFDYQFYRAICRQSWMAVFYIICNVSVINVKLLHLTLLFLFSQVFNSLYGIVHVIEDDNAIILSISYVIRGLTNSFTIGSYLFTAIIGSAMAVALTRIQSEFKAGIEQNCIVSDSVLVRKMDEVKRHYQQILLVVEQLHYHFELIFMAHVTFSFISVINLTFSIMKGFASFNRFMIYSIWVMDSIARIWFITHIPDRIKKSVRINANYLTFE